MKSYNAKIKIIFLEKLIFFPLVFLFLIAPYFVHAEDGLAAYWKFDEGAGTAISDSSGFGNNGTVNGATWADGKSGKSLSFDGTDDYVRVPHSSSLDFDDMITVEAWINPANPTAGSYYRGIVVKGGSTNDYTSSFQLFYLRDSNMVHAFIRYGPGANDYLKLFSPITMGKWSHVALVLKNDSLVKLFIDGLPLATGSLPVEKVMQKNTSDVFIGSTSTMGSAYQGGIDEVKIYHRALGDSEIAQHAQLDMNFSSSRLKSLMFFSWHDYKNINDQLLSKFADSPYDSFTANLPSAYDTSQPSYTDFLTNMESIKRADKKVWPLIYYNRIIGSATSSNPYFVNIYNNGKIMDLWDRTGALSDFYSIVRTSLKVAKNTNSGGIAIDPEPYNNYSIQNINYIATANGVSDAEVISALKEIGYKIADITNEEYSEATLLFFYANFTDRAASDNKYRGESYIAEGILIRAKEMGYKLSVVDGGEVDVGYLHESVPNLMAAVAARDKVMGPYTAMYPNLKLGATIVPYLQWDQTKTFTRAWCDSKEAAGLLEIRNIDDFLPMFKFLFSRHEYVWVYGMSTCGIQPYDEFNLALYPDVAQYRRVIQAAMCGNGVCETNRNESAANCPADCTDSYSSADLNQDSFINLTDFDILKSDFLKLTANLANPKSDIDGDGQATVKDVGIMMSGWKP